MAVVAIALLIAAVLGCGGTEQSESAQTAPASDTARISGPDPATLAANVAFAVYPANTFAQRPKSVTLVGEDSWQNAVAASVFMADALGAPLLISSAGGEPQPTTAALNIFQPHGNRLKHLDRTTNKGPAFLVIGPIATPTGGRTADTGATNGARQAKSIEAFRKTLFREASKRVVVAPENDPAFALPAAAWAAYSGYPVLYTRADKLPRATVASLRRFRPRAYVLGPTSVISPSVLAEIGKITKKAVKRISGKTPAENAVAFARYSDGPFGWNVNGPGHRFVIARSNEPLVAALSSPLSAVGTGGPLLLTESADRLPGSVREYLLDIKPTHTANSKRTTHNHVWIVGDEEAIDPDQQAEIEELTEAGKG